MMMTYNLSPSQISALEALKVSRAFSLGPFQLGDILDVRQGPLNFLVLVWCILTQSSQTLPGLIDITTSDSIPR